MRLIRICLLFLAVGCNGDDTDETDSGTCDAGPKDCAAFCATAVSTCTGANEVWADAAACETECAGFPTTGCADDTSGDTLQCREYHLGAAGTDPDTHCAHIGASSPVCQ